MLGRGFAFPLQLRGGKVGMNDGEERIRQSILLILGTALNERVMRPEFGAGMESLVFEPMGAVTGILLQHRVKEALTRFEPRIEVLSVTTEAAPGQGELHVALSYRIRYTGALDQLSYPFHLDRGAR
jgi:phage baseplate assembly protein W